MRKLLSVALIMTLMLSAFPFIVGSYAVTPTSGILTSDTTWETSQSPIRLTGSVCVSSGATLIIEPGVTVDLGDYYILVNGTLIAKGTSRNKICFVDSSLTDNSPNRQPQIKFSPVSKNSIIENANFNVVTIFIEGCSPDIRGNAFKNSTTVCIEARSGSAVIENNYFVDTGIYLGDGQGLSIGGSTLFNNNIISGVGYSWAIQCSGNAVLSNNSINGSYGAILAADNVSIKGNSIVNNKAFGISSAGNPTIEGNFIVDNSIGIEGTGSIKSNTIVNNTIGIKSPNSTITNNNIGNTQSNVFITNSENIDAANNWWGTTDTEAIKQTIWDFNNDFGLGAVNFEPILTQPSSFAPNVGSGGLIPTYAEDKQESNIVLIAEVVIIALIIGWAVAVIIFVMRKSNLAGGKP